MGGDLGGDALGDADADGLEGGDFFGVVGDEADGGDAEQGEDGCGRVVLAAVGLEAELEVGLDGVQPLLLQLVGLELGHEADAAALLVLVDEDAAAGGGDGGECELEGWRQSQRREWKTSPVRHWEWMRTMGGGGVVRSPMTRAMAVSTRVGVGALAGGGSGEETLEAEDAEVSPAGGEVGIGELAHGFKGHGSIIRGGARGSRDEGRARLRLIATNAHEWGTQFADGAGLGDGLEGGEETVGR